MISLTYFPGIGNLLNITIFREKTLYLFSKSIRILVDLIYPLVKIPAGICCSPETGQESGKEQLQ
jgi:hypothetical protein